MCVLPNFEASDLETFKRKMKSSIKNVEADTVELLVAEQPLENQP